ncbi:uncharacterized protein LOC119980362 [Tripterygium wilfordii]|uniref:uncharacterized protein LOC119980362 n=1 Tax=Tripterygium wilfordii TaxID=458696 RepID=UPI0018F827F1|nr:uncharacterized protein LOC119980362 [Tripterygium wilfordii]
MDDDPFLSLKLLMDHKSRMVLFAEASKDVVDFLFSILSLPLGAVASYQNPRQMAWSIGNLYRSMEDLRDLHMIPNKNIDFLVNGVVVTYPTDTTSSESPPMLLSTAEQSSPTKKSYYKCAANSGYSNCRSYVTLDPKSICPYCSTTMSSPLTLVSPTNEGSSSSSFEGGFVKGGVSYMIMDDLVVKPMSTISSIALFDRLNLKEVDALEEKTVNLTIDKVEKLLRASLQTKNVLNYVFFKERWCDRHQYT